MKCARHVDFRMPVCLPLCLVKANPSLHSGQNIWKMIAGVKKLSRGLGCWILPTLRSSSCLCYTPHFAYFLATLSIGREIMKSKFKIILRQDNYARINIKYVFLAIN